MPPEIEREVRKKGCSIELDMEIAVGLRICSPSAQYLSRVVHAAVELGEETRLSLPDKMLLALALGEDAVILTDDYSVQNVAAHLGIEAIKGRQRGIERIIVWQKKCTGCQKRFVGKFPGKFCPDCGSDIKTVIGNTR